MASCIEVMQDFISCPVLRYCVARLNPATSGSERAAHPCHRCGWSGDFLKHHGVTHADANHIGPLFLSGAQPHKFALVCSIGTWGFKWLDSRLEPQGACGVFKVSGDLMCFVMAFASWQNRVRTWNRLVSDGATPNTASRLAPKTPQYALKRKREGFAAPRDCYSPSSTEHSVYSATCDSKI